MRNNIGKYHRVLTFPQGQGVFFSCICEAKQNEVLMKIKDVEKLTGLTAKSIRYYESKGLIAVQHNGENGYRIYAEEDVLHLKRIKLLCYLDFSIEEIRCIQGQKLPEIQKTLQRQAEQFEVQSDICDMNDYVDAGVFSACPWIIFKYPNA